MVGDGTALGTVAAGAAAGREREHSFRPKVIIAPMRSALAHFMTACSRSTVVTRSLSFFSFSSIFDFSPAKDSTPVAIGPRRSDGIVSNPIFI